MNQAYKWKQLLELTPESAFDGQGKTIDKEEIRRLKKTLAAAIVPARCDMHQHTRQVKTRFSRHIGVLA